MEKLEEQGFNKGFAFAVAEVIRQFDEPTIAECVYNENYMSLAQLKQSGVCDEDIETIKKYIKLK